MTKSANPLIEAARSRPVKSSEMKIRQSLEVAPEPAPAPVFETKTLAAPPSVARRFSLGDLANWANRLFPVLKKRFPHLNDRMYGGWLRGCVADNECCFVVLDEPKGVAMAHMLHKPMSPVPFVEVDFVLIGDKTERVDEAAIMLYTHIVKWAKEIGAIQVNASHNDLHYLQKIKGFEHAIGEEIEAVVFLD